MGKSEEEKKHEADLKRRFKLIDEALDGLSNHDRIGLLGGSFGFILRSYMVSDVVGAILESVKGVDGQKAGT